MRPHYFRVALQQCVRLGSRSYGNAGATRPVPSKADPDYVQRQLHALKKLQQAEAGNLGRDDPGARTVPYILGGVLAVIFGYIGWDIYSNSERSAKTKSWLEEKEKEEGVVKLQSGLMYKVLKHGEGQHHPTARSTCACNYRGTLIDGTEFDSSYKTGTPAVFIPYKKIRGWSEALQLMVEGDNWELYLPPELAYGGDSSGSIPGGSALIFQMELVQIQGRRVLRKGT